MSTYIQSVMKRISTNKEYRCKHTYGWVPAFIYLPGHSFPHGLVILFCGIILCAALSTISINWKLKKRGIKKNSSSLLQQIWCYFDDVNFDDHDDGDDDDAGVLVVVTEYVTFSVYLQLLCV